MSTIATFLKLENGEIPDKKLVIKDDFFQDKASNKNYDQNELLKTLLEQYYSSGKIEIRQATIEVSPDGEFATVVGESDIFETKKVKVHLVLFGNAETGFGFTVVYELPEKWNFKDSFPKLPSIIKLDSLTKDRKDIFDDTTFIESSFVFTTSGFTQGKATFKPGLNFYGKKKADAFRYHKELAKLNPKAEDKVVYGTVNPNYQEVTAFPLLHGQQPWDLKDTAVGICLQSASSEAPIKLSEAVKVAMRPYVVYSPVDKEWMYENGTFRPLAGYRARLEITSGDRKLQLDCNAVIPPGSESMEISGNFKKRKLDSLDDIKGLIGEPKAESLFPSSLQQAWERVKQFELQNISLTLHKQGYVNFSLYQYAVTVGLKDVRWSALDGKVEVNEMSITLGKEDEQFFIQLTGKCKIKGIAFRVYAEYTDNFTLKAELDGEEEVFLETLLKEQLSADEAAPESGLVLDTVSATIVPSYQYAFSVAVSAKPAWEYKLGPLDFKFKEASADIAYYTQSGEWETTFATKVEINKVKFNANISYPNFKVKGGLPDIKLSQLVSAFFPAVNAVWPKNFDPVFKDTTVTIAKKNTAYSLELVTSIENTGRLAFMGRTVNGTWGFAAGAFFTVDELSKLQGMGDFVKKVKDYLPFDSLLLVASSIKDEKFKFSGFEDAINNPKVKALLDARADGIEQGFFLYSTVIFRERGNYMDTVRKFLKLETDSSAQFKVGYNIKDNQFDCGVAIKTSLFRKNGIKVNAYEDGEVEGSITLSVGSKPTTLTFGGALKMMVQKQKVQFNVALKVGVRGIMGSGTMVAEGNGTIKFESFEISYASLEIGATYEGVPAIGIAGRIVFEEIGTAEVALMFDSNDPLNCMLAGSTKELTMGQLVKWYAAPPKAVLKKLDGKYKAQKIPFGDMIQVKGLSKGRQEAQGEEAVKLVKALTEKDFAEVAKLVNSVSGNANPFSESADKLLLYKEQDRQIWCAITLANQKGEEIIPVHFTLEYIEGEKTVKIYRNPQIYLVPGMNGAKIGNKSYEQGFRILGRFVFLFLDVEAEFEVVRGKGVRAYAKMESIELINDWVFSFKGVEDNKPPMLAFTSFDDDGALNELHKKMQLVMQGRLSILGYRAAVLVDFQKDGGHFELELKNLDMMHGHLKGKFNGFDDIRIEGSLYLHTDAYEIFGKQISMDMTFSMDFSITIKPDSNNPRLSVCHSVFAPVIAAKTPEGDMRCTITKIEMDQHTDFPAAANLAIRMIKEEAGPWFDKLYQTYELAGNLKEGFVEGISTTIEIIKDPGNIDNIILNRLLSWLSRKR